MTISIDRFVRSTITRSTRTVSQRAFSVALIAVYHALYADRVREYEDPSDMLADGFTTKHPAYLAAVALCSQKPRPATFKVGRRVGTAAQTVRFTPDAVPTEAEVFSITIDGVTFSVTADASPTGTEITAALVALMQEDTDAVMTTPKHTAVTEVVVGPADYDGAMGDDTPFAPARNITITLNSHADWNATNATVVGMSRGRPVSETIAIPDAGNVKLISLTVWDSPPTVHIPAQAGTNGTFTIGVGVKFNDTLAFTVTNGTTHLDVVSTGTGAWFSYDEVTGNIAIEDRTAEPGTTLATDLSAIQAADANFVGLLIADAQSSAQILAAAAWAETQQVVYLAHSMDSAVEQNVGTDVASLALGLGYFHTEVFYSRINHGRFPDAAFLGSFLGGLFRAGDRKIAAFRQLSGIRPDELSATVVSRLIGTPTAPADGKRVLIYGDVAATGTNIGTACTLGGLTAGGEWIDVIIGLYFVETQIQTDAFSRMLSGPITFTVKGIAAFDASVTRSLQKCSAAPYNILDPASIETSFTALADVSDADKQARHYDGVRWIGKPQGAIQALDVGGNVSP